MAGPCIVESGARHRKSYVLRGESGDGQKESQGLSEQKSGVVKEEAKAP